MAEDRERVAHRIADLERMRPEFCASAPASLHGYIEHEKQRLRAISERLAKH